MKRLRTVSNQRYLSLRVALLSLKPSEADKSFFIWVIVVIPESSICVVMVTDYGRNPRLFQANERAAPVDSARRLEGLPDVAVRAQPVAISACRFRPGELRVLREATYGRTATEDALETVRGLR